MVTTSKLQFIKDNIYLPKAGEFTDADDNKSDYKIFDVWEDEHYLIPQVCMIIHKDHIEPLRAFLNSLPEFERGLDTQTAPYRRYDTVIGPALATEVFYIDPITKVETLIGYDDYPVVCLETNFDCYFDDCENWTRNDEVINSEVHQASATSLGTLLIESKVVTGQAYGLEAEGIAYNIFKEKFPDTSPDVFSVDPDDKVNYFDMPMNEVEWLEEE